MGYHDLKCVQPFFEGVLTGTKNFEIRKNDRNFQPGDQLNLKEYDPVQKNDPYTGWEVRAIVLSVWTDIPGLSKDYCAMEIRVVDALSGPN